MGATAGARLLGGADAAALAAGLPPGLPPLARAGLEAGLVMGRVRAALAGAPGAEAGLVAQGGEGCWTLVLPLGEPSPADLRAAFAAIAADASLVVWDDQAQPGWLEALAPLGARRFERLGLLQDLSRVDHPALPADPDLTIVPWPEAPDPEALLDALADASAGTLNGVFLTTPLPPTRDRVRRVLADVVAGHPRPFLPAASFVARRAGRPIGIVLGAVGEAPDEILLFDLLVDPAARGQGIARRLVMAQQAAARAAGLRRLRFCTHGHNDPVLRLFRPEELLEHERRPFACWAPAPERNAP